MRSYTFATARETHSSSAKPNVKTLMAHMMIIKQLIQTAIDTVPFGSQY